MSAEQQQIEYLIQKNHPEQVAVKNLEQVKKFCHQCTNMTEINNTQYSYQFQSGLIVYFCNEQEKQSWMESKHLIS